MTTTWRKGSRSLNNGTCVEVAWVNGGEGEPVTDWVKSSLCSTGACVEVTWHKSSHSSTGNCVEVAGQDVEVLVRDSKNPDGPQLRFTPAEWDAFLAGAKDGEFG